MTSPTPSAATPSAQDRGAVARHTGPGLPAFVEPLTDRLTLTKTSVGPMDNNAYLITDAASAVLIDAANDADRLLTLIGSTGPDVVITTHRHHDHLQALPELAGRGARLVAGWPDCGAIADAAGVIAPEGAWDCDTVITGGIELELIGLVGHTPGSIACVLRTPDRLHLFTGDALFPGGVGKTSSPADFGTLMDDLQAKVFDRFDDETVVHPGHGDSTTLGLERPQLAAWRSRGW